jgi:hypothetical protein
MWRNVVADYYGLFHYRRLLCLNQKYGAKITISSASQSSLHECGLDEATIVASCARSDVIVPTANHLGHLTLRQHYAARHEVEDLDICSRVINAKFPEYSSACMQAFNGSRCYFYNMFIMEKVVFKRYSEFLFGVLLTAEPLISRKDSDYQNRVFGFLAERLTSVFLLRLKQEGTVPICERPLVHCDFAAPPQRRIAHWLRRKVNLSWLGRRRKELDNVC